MLLAYYKSGRASWTDVVQALRSMQMDSKAEALEEHYCPQNKSGNGIVSRVFPPLEGCLGLRKGLHGCMWELTLFSDSAIAFTTRLSTNITYAVPLATTG